MRINTGMGELDREVVLERRWASNIVTKHVNTCELLPGKGRHTNLIFLLTKRSQRSTESSKRISCTLSIKHSNLIPMTHEQMAFFELSHKFQE